MNKFAPLILFASMLAISCSSATTSSMNVGDSRIAISSASIGFGEITASDNLGTNYETIETSSADINFSFGTVVAENLELGGMLMIDNTTTDYQDGYSISDDMNALGAYARYYMPSSGGMVPWVEASLVLSGTQEQSDNQGNYATADLFGVGIGVGVSSFISENAAIEFALTQSSAEVSNMTGFSNDYVLELDTTEVTMGLSLSF
jgi:hypothetical protein